jgi:signal transduction histidine kinase
MNVRPDLPIVVLVVAMVWCVLLLISLAGLTMWANPVLLALNLPLLAGLLGIWAVCLMALLAYAAALAGRRPGIAPAAPPPVLGSERLGALEELVERVVQGDFSVRADASSNDQLGSLGRALNQMLDATANRAQKLDEERARFLASINSLPVGFIMADAQNSILTFNPAMQRILEVSDSDHLDKIQHQLESKESFIAQLMDSSQKVLESGQPLHIREVAANRRLYRVYVSPVTPDMQSSHIIGCAILVEDVTEEQIMNRSKEEFFSIASHELRTPLTAIRGNTAMIQQYFEEHITDPELKEMVNDIHTSSVRLISIVNDFLDASRLEQGKMAFRPEPFAIKTVLDQVVEELHPAAKTKRLSLRVTTTALAKLPPAYADQTKVHQVLYNLVDNAIKFTDKGGVTIKARLDGGHLRVYVLDTGKGLSEEGQRILFHKFQQGNEDILTRDNTQGTGLGLYISKLLLERMGGSIQLDYSEPQNGTAFSFTLPVSQTPATPAAKPAATPRAKTAKPSTPPTAK